jgi:uncharacterized DUF497 family protein
MAVEVTFDPAKRDKTFEERGLDFADAPLVFGGKTIDVEDRRFDYGETRTQTVGFLAGRMVMVVWTPRGDARRIISMRHCHAKEERRWRAALA